MKRIGIKYLTFNLLILIFIGLLILNSQKGIESGRQAVELCLKVIVPTLFPFIVCTEILTNTGFGEKLGRPFSKIFKLSNVAGFAVMMGMIGGFPIGAKIISDSYAKRAISKQEAEKVLAFSNNASPMFIIGTVGIGMYNSLHKGIVLFLAQLLAVFTMGFFSKMYICPIIKGGYGHTRHDIINIFNMSIKNSGNLVINLSCFITFFAILISILNLSEISGFIEVTNGLLNSKNIIFSAFLLGFSGLCVHFQVLSLTEGLSMFPYFIGKICQAFLSAFYTAILSLVYIL